MSDLKPAFDDLLALAQRWEALADATTSSDIAETYRYCARHLRETLNHE